MKRILKTLENNKNLEQIKQFLSPEQSAMLILFIELLKEDLSPCKALNQIFGKGGECFEDDNTCVPGLTRVNGVCVEDDKTCDSGWRLVNGECFEDDKKCNPGFKRVNGVCVEDDGGHIWADVGVDVGSDGNCPEGYTKHRKKCYPVNSANGNRNSRSNDRNGSNNHNKNHNKSGLSTEEIIGIVIGSIAGVILITGLCYYGMRKRTHSINSSSPKKKKSKK